METNCDLVETNRELLEKIVTQCKSWIVSINNKSWLVETKPECMETHNIWIMRQRLFMQGKNMLLHGGNKFRIWGNKSPILGKELCLNGNNRSWMIGNIL